MEISRSTPYRSCSPGLRGFGSGVTHQEFRDLCDINAILRRYCATGVLPQCHGMVSLPCDSFLYGDFSEIQNTLNFSKNELDLASEAVCPSEFSSEDSSVSVQKEGENVTGDGVKGDNPEAYA